MDIVKFVSVFAGLGFILSLFFGLFSHSNFLIILLKAFGFAIGFAILGFLIHLIYGKFLDDGSDSDEPVADNGPAEASNSKGQVVDITIQDEELPPGDSDNHFVVGDNHQMLNETDFKRIENRIENSSEAAQAAKDAASGFVPLRKNENSVNVSGKESVSPDSVEAKPLSSIEETMKKQNAASVAGPVHSPSSAASDGSIDTLPDMDSLGFNGDAGESFGNVGTGNDEILNDGPDQPLSSGRKNTNFDDDKIQDAGLMAKAISSVLADENS